MTGKKKDVEPLTHEHLESWYQNRIIRRLKKRFPGAFIWKAAAGVYSTGGIPDILMVYYGQLFGFEVKRPGNYATLLQRQQISKIQAAGGIALVVTEPEEAEKAVDSLLEHLRQQVNRYQAENGGGSDE